MNRLVPTRATALLATAALLVAGLAGCSDSSASSQPDAGAPVTRSSDASTSSEPTTDTSPDPTTQPGDEGEINDADLDPALSDPVEDSVYPDVGDPGVDSLHYDLDLTWTPTTKTLDGVEELTFRSTATADHVQLDLEKQLEVASVQLDGADAEFQHQGKNLVVSGDFTQDARYVLTISYSGSPQPVQAPTTRSDFSTTGWTVAADGAAWTMQEPFGAYSWYAANDQPSDKAFYDFTLTTPTPFVGIANGELTSREESGADTVTTWHLDSRASSYLVTVAFGDYTMGEDTSESGVPITYWVPKSAKSYAASLDDVPDALAWVESKLGPYPWSSLGILLVDSRSGLETQTMITLGATDYTTQQDTLVHEIVHQWYGDEVTPSDWRDMWMNEGMAMYLQFVYQSETTGTPLRKILHRAVRYERFSRRVNGPPADYEPGTFGEINVYYGPALMWDQIRRRVGADTFWAMVRDWPSYDKDGSVGRADYLPWIEDETGTELSDLFDGWLFAKKSPKF